MSAIEVRSLQIKIAHPALQRGAGVACAQLREMSFIKQRRESESSELAGRPKGGQRGWRPFGEDSEQGVDTERGREQECRIVKQHGKVQAQGKRAHAAGGVLGESIV